MANLKVTHSRLRLTRKYLLQYLTRVVLAHGFLKSRTSRICVVASGIFLVSLLTVLAVYFLRPASDDRYAQQVIFAVTSVSAAFWASTAVLVVKVLMSSSQTMLKTTNFLPITSKERKHALDLLEVTIALTVIGIALFSVTVASVITFGLSTVPFALTNIVFPAVFTYGALLVFFRVFEYLLYLMRVNRFRSTVSILLSFMTTVSVSALIPKLIQNAMEGVETPFSAPTLVFFDLWRTYGVAGIAFGLVIIVALWSVGLLLIPSAPLVSRSRFAMVPIFRIFKNQPLGIHLVFLFRNRYTWEAVVLVLGAALAWQTGYISRVSPVWLLEPLTLTGFFHYANVLPVVTKLDPYLSARDFFFRMVASQVLFVAPVAILVAVVSLFWFPILPTLFALGGVLVSSIITLGIGILMPTIDDNPVSVFVGTGALLTVGFLILTVSELIALNLVLKVLLAFSCLIGFCYCSFWSIKNSRKEVNVAS